MKYVKALTLFLKTILRKFYNPFVHAKLVADTLARCKFYSGFIDGNDLVFDIGANLGNRIQPLLNIGAKIVAAEPQTLCHTYLRLRFGKKITCLKVALGATQYESSIHLNDQSTTVSSMSEEWINAVKESRFKTLSWNKTERVSVTNLDYLMIKYGHPKFIKIDVEGFEVEVLKGLHTAIPIVCFEYTTPERTENLIECVNLLHHLDSNYQYNYSVGELNNFALSRWISADELRLAISRNVDELGGFGDIYARQPNIKFEEEVAE